MKTWDVVIVGGGIIGLSLALGLRKHGAAVLVVERQEPGREASHAAAGMLAHCDPHTPQKIRSLAMASAQLYPEFVHQLEDESGQRVDLRQQGSIILEGEEASLCRDAQPIRSAQLQKLEPGLATSAKQAEFWPEASVDPRALTAAALKAAKHRGIEVATGAPVVEIEVTSGRASAAKTARTHFPAAAVVNCAGAWAGQIAGAPALPTRPVKGQMLSLIAPRRDFLRHVVRGPGVYLVPRSDGRILVGATVEEAGFDKRTDADTIQGLHQAAANLAPELGQARMLEAWAGLRPGTPDNLPILGATSLPGYFVATGHFRDGILLTPATALVMTQVVRGARPEFDLSAFAPARFEK
ncbi:MAG TPA: glycine oxidase ThiO [Terriglobales bacterium]|nr:glycine oxidase ThiO [Terriglobales bacterium]